MSRAVTEQRNWPTMSDKPTILNNVSTRGAVAVARQPPNSALHSDRDSVEVEADIVRGGSNGELSLTQARANFATLHACEERFSGDVRAPEPAEFPKLA
jgi:hypothetical protein